MDRTSSAAKPGTAPGIGETTLRRVRWRILPLIVVLYLVAYLDRNNVGFAKAGLAHDLGIHDAAYGLGAGIFFVGYVLLEIPSNAAMYRFGARRWISRILVTWGVLATAMALVSGETSFLVLRFLLGAAEAGFFPAVVFYFTLWFPTAQRAAVLGVFVLAQPVANAVGAPLSGTILNLDGHWGLHGWQWVFVAEGLPAIALGVLTLFWLTDRPEDAAWLSAEQRAWLTRTMNAELAAKASPARRPFLAGLKSPNAWAYGLLNFGMVCGIYGLGLWLPAIVTSLGRFGSGTLGWLVMVPYAAAVPCVYWWSRRADRTGRRALHASVSMVVAAVGLVAAGYLLPVSAALALIFLSVAAIGIFSAIAPFLSIPAALFSGAAAAASLGLVNSLGNIGGFVAPYAVGVIKSATGSDRLGLTFLAACLVVTAAATYRYAHRRPEGNAAVNAS